MDVNEQVSTESPVEKTESKLQSQNPIEEKQDLTHLSKFQLHLMKVEESLRMAEIRLLLLLLTTKELIKLFLGKTSKTSEDEKKSA